MKSTGGEARRLPENSGKLGRATETNCEANLRHRDSGLGQQYLCLLDATLGLIPVRWLSKGLLESSAEVIQAQIHKMCQVREWYSLRNMLVNIGGKRPLLPSSEPTSDLGLDAWRAANITY